MKFIFLRDVEIPTENQLVTIETACTHWSISKRILIKSIKNGVTPAPITLKGKYIGWPSSVFRRCNNKINAEH
jgi:predicted DNA-binding transcriptional regulator AlpA